MVNKYYVVFIGLFLSAGLLNAGSVSSPIHIQLQIPLSFSYQIISNVGSLEVSKKDVRNALKNSAKKIRDAWVFSVDTNNAEGYMLTLQALSSDLYSRVGIEIKNTGEYIEIQPGQSHDFIFPSHDKKTDEISVNYYFFLVPEVSPGVYPMPMNMMLSPV